MDEQEGFSTNKAPIFDGSDYVFWKRRMQTYLMSLGYDIWSADENGYTTPKTPLMDTNGMRLGNNNSRVKNSILCSLEKSVYTKVMHCALAKEMWDKL
jgi:hypothetical protein